MSNGSTNPPKIHIPVIVGGTPPIQPVARVAPGGDVVWDIEGVPTSPNKGTAKVSFEADDAFQKVDTVATPLGWGIYGTGAKATPPDGAGYLVVMWVETGGSPISVMSVLIVD